MNRKLLSLAGVVAISGGTLLGAIPASAARCTTTNTHTYSISSRGSQTWTNRHKVACGVGNFDEWTHRYSLSYTGAHSTANTYKDDDNRLWWSHEHMVSVSKADTVRVTDTYRHN